MVSKEYEGNVRSMVGHFTLCRASSTQEFVEIETLPRKLSWLCCASILVSLGLRSVSRILIKSFARHICFD